MKLRVTAAAALLLLMPGTAFASDEPEPPSPSIGEPVITIPIDTDVIAQLIVTDIELTPTTGLVPGDSVRLVAQIAAGSAPTRTVIVIDGVGEIVGDVEVAPDGSIDHAFTLPADLPAGSHSLSLAALELGIAPLGVIEVVQPAAPAPSTTAAESQPAAPVTTAPGELAIDEPADDESSLALSLTIAALVFVVLILLMVFLDRRRKRAVARFEGAASLPTATQQLHVAPHDDDVDIAEAAAVAAITAPTEPEDANDAEPDESDDAAPATPEPEGARPTDSDDSERGGTNDTEPDDTNAAEPAALVKGVAATAQPEDPRPDDGHEEAAETEPTEPPELDVAGAATAEPEDSQPDTADVSERGDTNDTGPRQTDDEPTEPDDTAAATVEAADAEPEEEAAETEPTERPELDDAADTERADIDDDEPTEEDDTGAATAEPEESQPDDGDLSEEGDAADTESPPQADEVVVVELTARGADGDDAPAEQVLGVFSDVERAKEAARRARQEGDSERTEEMWWEVRSERGPVWMIHAWAPREYEINSETGEATAASR